MIGMQTTTKIGGAIGGVPLDPVLGRDGAPRRPRRTFLPAAARPAATGDDGVANTLLRRGVAATLPASFGVRVKRIPPSRHFCDLLVTFVFIIHRSCFAFFAFARGNFGFQV
jgi:hypothetical protein